MTVADSSGDSSGVGSSGDFLSEAAAYLRLPESEVVGLIQTQGLPGRFVAGEFFRGLRAHGVSGLKDGLLPAGQFLELFEQLLEFIEELRELVDDELRLLQPARGNIYPAPAKSHVVTHHARAGQGLE